MVVRTRKNMVIFIIIHIGNDYKITSAIIITIIITILPLIII